MRKNALSREEVRKITPQQVHEVISRTMLADGFPIVVDLKKSQGMYLYDAREGKYYLDFFSYFASWALGHNHPKMEDPEFLEKLHEVAKHKPSNSDFYTVEMAQFVATFERVAMTDDFRYLFFIDGGALAVENALKTAFDWKVRKNIAAGKGERGYKVIYFKDAFHGRSGYTLTLTNTFDPNKTKFFPKFTDWHRIENPKITFPLEGENLRAVEEAEKRAVEQMEKILSQEADDIAAIIIEPIQAEGGDNHFRGEFFRQLRRLADDYDVMLIFDEVQTGIGLTGKMWAYEHFGVVPDIISFGKKAQVCGIMVGPRVDEVPDNVFKVSSRINSTWGGNLTDMVRSQRILEIIEEDNLVQNAAEVGEYLLNKLLELQAEFPDKISNTRGRGLMCAFDLPNSELRDKLREEVFKRGCIVLPCGEKSIRFRPALVCQREDVDKCTAIIYDALKSLD
ncbi:MAG TPA: L-lysine 6-transaminase [candidate division Zixibacteria bacterium]|nr:L-lysine 6-transaminase [candidate division Zixibacteria bacterium]